MIAAVVLAATAGAEQATSKQQRLPAGLFAAGNNHTCAILSTGRVRCWGLGIEGRLGYGNTASIGDDDTPASAGPVDLGTGRRAVAISAGGAHTCAILDTGAVRCWGDGAEGHLGYGNTDDIGDNETPASVNPLDLGAGRRATAITVGGDHSCAILDTGKVRCWGFGQDGRLGYGNVNTIGDNETPGSAGPVDLGTGRRAVAIAAGDFHTCAILDTGQVRCWGYGANGSLGYGNASSIGDNETPGSVAPVDLGVGRRAVAISGGGFSTCALLDNGAVLCWGPGEYGQLGTASTDAIGDDETPGSASTVGFGAGERAVAISSGSSFSCALLDSGRVRCWGYGGDGQLGYGNTDNIGDNELPGSVSPVDLGADRKAVAISLGTSHSCALLDIGRVRCWGSNPNGRLGLGNGDTIGDDETPGGFGPVDLGGLMTTKAKPTLSLALGPKRDARAPFRFKASGTLSGFLADSATCSGQVVVKAKRGGKSAVKRPKLTLNAGRCSYSASFKVSSAGKWKVTASFAGNGSLRSRASSPRTFAAG
jgi:alpha-tubulin suppressor-like RCC1 family protein